MPEKHVTAKRRSSSRKSAKSSVSAVAVRPLITKLYDGSAELHISIPQRQANQTIKDPSGEKEIISLTLPSAGRQADEHACIASLISSLTLALLDDSESAKKKTRKAVQAEGISRALSEGKQFGKPRMAFDADLFAEVCRAYANKEISVDTAGERLGCSARTFRRRYASDYLANLDSRKHILEQGA